MNSKTPPINILKVPNSVLISPIISNYTYEQLGSIFSAEKTLQKINLILYLPHPTEKARKIAEISFQNFNNYGALF